MHLKAFLSNAAQTQTIEIKRYQHSLRDDHLFIAVEHPFQNDRTIYQNPTKCTAHVLIVLYAIVTDSLTTHTCWLYTLAKVLAILEDSWRGNFIVQNNEHVCISLV